MHSLYKNLLKVLLLTACFGINLFAQIAPFKQVDTKTLPNNMYAILKNTPGVVIAGGEGKAAVNIKTGKYYEPFKPYIDENIIKGLYDTNNKYYLLLTFNGYNQDCNLYTTMFNGTAHLLKNFKEYSSSFAVKGNDIFIPGNKKIIRGTLPINTDDQFVLGQPILGA